VTDFVALLASSLWTIGIGVISGRANSALWIWAVSLQMTNFVTMLARSVVLLGFDNLELSLEGCIALEVSVIQGAAVKACLTFRAI
jgi:hypothetical protein